jgi:hypothetical protein
MLSSLLLSLLSDESVSFKVDDTKNVCIRVLRGKPGDLLENHMIVSHDDVIKDAKIDVIGLTLEQMLTDIREMMLQSEADAFQRALHRPVPESQCRSLPPWKKSQ